VSLGQVNTAEKTFVRDSSGIGRGFIMQRHQKRFLLPLPFEVIEPVTPPVPETSKTSAKPPLAKQSETKRRKTKGKRLYPPGVRSTPHG
jgi:hypothetical protein